MDYRATLVPSIRLVWKCDPRQFVILLSLSAANAVLPLCSIYISSGLIGVLADSIHSAPGQIPDKILVLIGLFGVVAVLGPLLSRTAHVHQLAFQRRVANSVQSAVFGSAAIAELGVFETPQYHNKLLQASRDSRSRPFAIVQSLVLAASSVVSLAVTGLVIAAWHPWLVPLLAIGPAIMLRLSGSAASEKLRITEANLETERRAGYYGMLLTSDVAAKDIRIYNLQTGFLDRLKALWEQLDKTEADFAKRNLLKRELISCALNVDKVIVLGFAGVQVIGRKITLGEFSLYSQAAMSMQSHVRVLVTALTQLHEHHLFLANLGEFLVARPPRPCASKFGLSIRKPPFIEFREVTFRYPNSSRNALNKVNLELRPGEVVALVGGNGSGKTTLAKLLCGLYRPTAGAILVDHVDLRDIEAAEWKARLSVIMQDFQVYHFSAFENIALGADGIGNLEDKVPAAARAAGVNEVIERLPDGYQSLLGRHFRRGHELSGGQRQQIAVARAFLREGSVWIVDEPTSALDVQNEQLFLDRVFDRSAAPARSVLFISHRLAAVRRANRIVVLDEGSITEVGSHNDLIAKGGRYSALFNEQARPFYVKN